MIVDVYARQAFSGTNTSMLSHCSGTAWNQRCSDHFQRVAKGPLAQWKEIVRGDSSSAWTFVPKVDVGVAPCEGAATKPKGSVPKVGVGVAPCEGTAAKPKGSVALAAQPPNCQTNRTPKKTPKHNQLAFRRRLTPP